MDKMRADMGGAACVAGSLQAAASLGLPLNIKGKKSIQTQSLNDLFMIFML